jgi:hypothetical protein
LISTKSSGPLTPEIVQAVINARSDAEADKIIKLYSENKGTHLISIQLSSIYIFSFYLNFQ